MAVIRSRRSVALVPAALALAMAFTAAPALGQVNDTQTLLDRIERLQRDVTAMQRTVYRGDAPPAAAGAGPQPGVEAPVATLNLRVNDLERELSSLTGRIEELGFQMRQLSDRLSRVTADLDFRLKELAAQPGAGSRAPAAAAAPVAAPPAPPQAAAPGAQPPGVRSLGTVRPAEVEAVRAAPQAPAAGARPPAAAAATPPAGVAAPPAAAAPAPPQTAALPAGNPDTQYDQAYGLLLRRDYAGAEVALRAFVQAYPTHAKAGDAQYWLGETYYVREDYAGAARAFATGYQQYPKHERASSDLLKMGLSLKALERKQDACVTFAKLIEEFPSAAANIRDRAQAERKALSCA